MFEGVYAEMPPHLRRQRQQAGVLDAMPRKTMIEAIRDAMDVSMERDEQRRRVRRGCRLFRRRLPLHRGPAAEIRHEPLLRRADQRSRHRRHRHRHGRLRPAALRRNPVRRLHVSGLRPDRVGGGAAALPLNGEFTCPIVVRMPTGGGIFGGQTHSQSPEALFTHVSGLKTVVPSNPYDAKGLLISAIEDPRSGDLPRTQAALQRPVRRPSRAGR